MNNKKSILISFQLSFAKLNIKFTFKNGLSVINKRNSGKWWFTSWKRIYQSFLSHLVFHLNLNEWPAKRLSLKTHIFECMNCPKIRIPCFNWLVFLLKCSLGFLVDFYYFFWLGIVGKPYFYYRFMSFQYEISYSKYWNVNVYIKYFLMNFFEVFSYSFEDWVDIVFKLSCFLITKVYF